MVEHQGEAFMKSYKNVKNQNSDGVHKKNLLEHSLGNVLEHAPAESTGVHPHIPYFTFSYRY